MPGEIASVARPTGLRVAGSVCVALGAVAAGVGATREWVAVGFTADMQHAADVSVHGVDVWEGKVVLFVATAALLVLLALRISGSLRARGALAIVLIVLGAACIAIPLVDAARATRRFGGVDGADRLARTLTVELGLPEEIVREQLSEQFEQDLRIEIAPGVIITCAGGVLLALGGVLSLPLARREPVVDDGPTRPG